MANPLKWQEGEGYDIHVLRRGPSSKALDRSFDINPQFPLTQFPLVFIPHFKGAPNAHGVSVDTNTGVIRALAHPNAAQPKLRNFLMTVGQRDSATQSIIFETMVRVHVHDSVQKIWLTPSTLTIHTHADECRFTVLAQFDDDSVGDITDWPQPQLSWTSEDVNSVNVLADGILVAEPGRHDYEMEVKITATLKLTTPPTNESATAKVATRENWTFLGEKTPVQWVDGPVRPNEQDLASDKRESVKSVVQGRMNILFISEGFLQSQKTDFDKAVEYIVKTGLRQDILQPFKLLKDSINYWSVFLRSGVPQQQQEGGISLLGDYEITGTSPNEKGVAVPRPEEPASGATSWSVENMIHQVGLPVPKDPVQSIPDWVTHWNKLYNIPQSPQVIEGLVTANFSDWNSLRSHTPLNERDSVFGMAHRTRTRVSDAGGGDPMLRPSLRRPKEASIEKFIESLKYGIAPPGGDPYNIGETWARTEKDQGLVCFICLSDVAAGEARPGYFTASTGFEKLARLITAVHGKDIKTAPLSDPKAPYDPDILASLVAHECGHALGLGDEYGPGSSAHFVSGVSGAVPLYPNLQTKDVITSTDPTSGATVYDPTKIKWLWPRTVKVGRMERAPTALATTDFQMPLVPGHGRLFAKGDLVLIREAPLRRSDPYLDLRFVVDRVFPNAVDVIQQSGPPLDVTLYNPNRVYVLICANIAPGPELKLIAEPILNYIRTTGGPLNAPKGNPAAACVAALNAVPFMSPTNLPALTFKKRPSAPADIIGIYEGGGHYDCGVFRPAGRCKMRTGHNKVIPFCHICRYLMVDRVDPMKLADLDKMYDPYYPR